MAEVLGPLGTAASLLSLIFATIPTVMKARQNFLECVEQLRRYKVRVSSCDARTNALLERCRGFKLSQSSDKDWIIEDIARIREKMHAELKTYTITDAELSTWRNHKVIPSRIQDQLMKRPTQYFRSTLYALYQRNIIEDWVTGMEKSVDLLERLMQVELETQTAGHFKTIDQDVVSEVEDLKQFVTGISTTGDTIYKGTVASPKTTTAHDWALGIRSPEELNDISNWRFAKVSIEVSFSGPRSLKKGPFWMHTYQEPNGSHKALDRIQIERAVLSQLGKQPSCSIPTVSCYSQDEDTKRTRPLGILLREAPELFLDLSWKPNRASLVHGLVNWALLLWDTNWFKHLCAYGVRFEIRPHPKDYMPILSANSCSVDACGNSDVRIRNLGIMLAEIVLTTPLRQHVATVGAHQDPRYQQLKGKSWIDISASAIRREVRSKTKSVQYANTVHFCLTDLSVLATSKFQPGYAFRCVEKIYRPIREWYDTEARYFESIEKLAEKKRNGSAKQGGWPEAAMDRRADSLQSEHPPPCLSTVWNGDVVA